MTYDNAKAELSRVLAWLKTLSTSAANSLEEAFDTGRTLSRRVKRWNGTDIVLRWAGAGLVKAESSFRRVKGYKVLPPLLSALDDGNLQATREVA